MALGNKITSDDYDVAVNGIMSGITTCIGCSKEFEDFWLESEGADPMPVCSECEKTMEP